jgi:hypothetical protein
MVIEFGQNASGSLMVGINDDPVTLAKRFCFKNNIDPHVISTLAANIRSLQGSSFNQGFRVDRNTSAFEDKENRNTENTLQRSRGRSGEKSTRNSQLKISRSKTNQSLHNESMKMSNSRSNGYTVFDRLYQDSRKKQTSRTELANHSKRSESSRMSVASQNRSLNESSIQGCLHIYEKNTKMKEEAAIHNQHLLEAKIMKEVEGCSFQPQINHLSSLIATKLRELDESSILNRTGGDKQMLKIKEYLLKKEEEEMRECTFKPKIKSKGQLSQTGTQKFSHLYDDQMIKETKRKLMAKR